MKTKRITAILQLLLMIIGYGIVLIGKIVVILGLAITLDFKTAKRLLSEIHHYPY